MTVSKGVMVGRLTEEHRGREWMDPDGDIWFWDSGLGAWACVFPGMDTGEFGPFTRVDPDEGLTER